jgi:predicted transcriptional regulator of viral defense system
MARSTRESARTLASLAQEQAGYFTAKQAQEAGYEYSQLVYHVSAGNFERVEHGLYRLPTIPPGEHDELVRLVLWSRNQKDEPQAVASHQTALVLHDLSEILPGEIHVTVPPRFRKPAPIGCVLHKAALAEGDVEERAGFRVTTPLRTILDVAGGSVSLEQLGKAVDGALARGLVRRKVLDAALKRSPHRDRVEAVVGRKDGAR